MLNEQPPDPKRRVHPLDRPPAPPSEQPEGEPPRKQQVTLHIPSVRPLVTYTLLGIMIAVFVIRALSPSLDEALLLWGANSARGVLAEGEIYRLITSMFLHASIYDRFGRFALENSLHLIFNAYMLYIVGSTIERLFGHVRFALVFLLGGLAGSVFSVVLGGGLSVGASGAVFAILGAQFVYLYQHRKLLGAGGRRQMSGLIQLLAFNLLFGFVANAASASVRIDNWAHIGGALGGIALAFGIAPLYIVRAHPELPGHLIAEDINPLRRRWWVVSAYSVALMLILIVARQAYTP
jgi:rhomboid protease GluP